MPGLGLSGESHREVIVGGLAGGWVAYDGRIKLVKYANGNVALFDMLKDPVEQINLIDSTDHAADYRRLDAIFYPWSCGRCDSLTTPTWSIRRQTMSSRSTRSLAHQVGSGSIRMGWSLDGEN